MVKPVLSKLYKKGIRTVYVVSKIATKTSAGHWLMKPCAIWHANTMTFAGVEDHIWLNRKAVRLLPDLPAGQVVAFTARMNEITLLTGERSIRLEFPVLDTTPGASWIVYEIRNRRLSTIVQELKQSIHYTAYMNPLEPKPTAVALYNEK